MYPSPNPSLKGRGICFAITATLFLFLSTLLSPAYADIKVISGDEILTADGRDVRLTGIKSPADTDKALADQSRDILQKLIGTRTLGFENVSTDRYGRMAAQVYAEKKDSKRIWLQDEMLLAGLAFVYPPSGSESHLNEMLKAESAARQAQRGIWANDVYADISAEKAKYNQGKFGFVSGTVLTAKRVKNKVYLNFGEDWHEDFSVAIAAHDLHFFRKAGIDPLSYQGKTIRVRGWIKREMGPMITVTHPAQIELLVVSH